jgi:hypothetical protein
MRPARNRAAGVADRRVRPQEISQASAAVGKGTGFAARGDMFALPSLQGHEFVVAMRRLGFVVKSKAAGLSTLCRHSSAVIVPESATLAPALVRAMLRAAGVDPFDFLEALDAAYPALRGSDAFDPAGPTSQRAA